MHPQDNINLHSEELDEALGTPPSWLARYGIQVAYLAIIVMVATAYFVKYPDVVEAKMQLTVPNPSVELLAKQTGLIEQVYVDPNEIVEAGQLLVVFASTANLADIDTLEKQLRFFKDQATTEEIKRFQPITTLQLGKIQEEYAEFLKNYNALNYGTMSNNERNKISRKTGEIRDLEGLILLEEQRLLNLSQRLETAIKTRERIKKVYSEDAKRYFPELNNASTKIEEIEADQNIAHNTISRYERDIQRIENEIADIRQSTGNDNQLLTFQISESIDKLKSQIRIWKNEHLLYAPIAGRVIFSKNFANDNQTVRQGSRILEIYPAGDLGEVYAKVDLPNYNSGSVKVGQEVLIKVDNYPYARYGKLQGIVRSKQDVLQENNTYKVEVSLEHGLLTSKNQMLDFAQGMQGTAQIVTEKKRFLYRLFDNVFAELHR